MRASLFIIALLAFSCRAEAAPRVVASILPVHALAAAVMKGIGEPELLLPPGASAHTYSMKPSDAAKLAQAEIVFWIGPSMEMFLVKSVGNMPSTTKAVQLMAAQGLSLRSARGPLPDERDVPPVGAEQYDPHIWLDPDNAVSMAVAMAEALAAADPANMPRYAANLQALAQQIDALDGEIRKTLAPVQGIGFIAFHDAYLYYEGRYGLSVLGVVAPAPDRQPGATRVKVLKEVLQTGLARCIFTEPQFQPKLARALVDGTKARIGELDPEGAKLKPGPDAYAALMRGMAKDIVDCLSR